MLVIDNVGISPLCINTDGSPISAALLVLGLHNTLEPIAFGLPVIFGTWFRNEEARYLVSPAEGSASAARRNYRMHFPPARRGGLLSAGFGKYAIMSLAQQWRQPKAAAYIRQLI